MEPRRDHGASDRGRLIDEILSAREVAFLRERTALVPIDPFALLRRERDELRHRAVLRWLLDEQGSHGLGRAFARAFVGALGRELPADRYTMAVEVRGAESTLDVLLDGPGLLVGIEVKVFSSEGVKQTEQERRDPKRIAQGREVVLVYLTPWGGPTLEPNALPPGQGRGGAR